MKITIKQLPPRDKKDKKKEKKQKQHEIISLLSSLSTMQVTEELLADEKLQSLVESYAHEKKIGPVAQSIQRKWCRARLPIKYGPPPMKKRIVKERPRYFRLPSPLADLPTSPSQTEVLKPHEGMKKWKQPRNMRLQVLKKNHLNRTENIKIRIRLPSTEAGSCSYC